MANPRSHERRPQLWAQLNLFGLHRRKREAVHGLGEAVQRLEHLVALLNQLAAGIFADDDADDLGSGVTMLKNTVKGIMEGSLELATWLGEIRFMSHLVALTIEEPDDDEHIAESANGDGDADPDDCR